MSGVTLSLGQGGTTIVPLAAVALYHRLRALGVTFAPSADGRRLVVGPVDRVPAEDVAGLEAHGLALYACWAHDRLTARHG